STASLVAGLALVESPSARSVTESDPWLRDQGLCFHEPAQSRIKPVKPRRSDVDRRQLVPPLSTPTVYATPGESAPKNSRSCRTREGRPRHDVRSGCDLRHLCRDRLHLCLEWPTHPTSGRLWQSPRRPKQTRSCASRCSTIC